MINLDDRQFEYLQGKNASELIRGLLNDYMKRDDINMMDEEQLRKELLKDEILQEANKKIQEIQ